jgi:hypothetical protein
MTIAKEAGGIENLNPQDVANFQDMLTLYSGDRSIKDNQVSTYLNLYGDEALKLNYMALPTGKKSSYSNSAGGENPKTKDAVEELKKIQNKK